MEGNGKRTEYIVATLDDYAQAYGLVTSEVVPELFSKPRPRNDAQLLQMLRLMLQMLRLMWEEAERIVKQGEEKTEDTEDLVERIQEVRFTRQDVMRLTNLAYTQTKRRLEKLVRLGALSSESLGRGGRIVYRIAVNDMEAPLLEDPLLEDLIPPDELRELWTSTA